MTALIIISVIVILLVFLLLSSVSFCFEAEDKPLLKLRYLCLCKKFDLSENGEKDKKDKYKGKKSLKGFEGHLEPLKKMFAEKGVCGAVSELLSIAKSFLKSLGKAVKHIRVTRFSFFLSVASDDPAKTAVEYGTLCGIVFPTLEGAFELFKWNKDKTKVSVKSDFCSNEPSAYISVKAKIRVIFLLCAVVSALAAMVRLKLKTTEQGSSDKYKERNF